MFLDAIRGCVHTFVSDEHTDATALKRIYESTITVQVSQHLFTSYLAQYSLDLYVLGCDQTVRTHVRLGRTHRRNGLETNL